MPKSQINPPLSRTFWPRVVQPGLIAADFDVDRPCGNCGYNLRGLPPRQPCPECGSVGGINLTDEPIPFNERQNLAAFFATALMVLTRPHDFARQVWRPVWLNPRAAKLFRRIALLVGVPTLSAIAFAFAYRIVGARAALCVLPFNLAGTLVWLHGLTHFLERFFRAGLAPRAVEPRAKVAALYPSATFLLLPVQFALLLVTVQTIPYLHHPWNWQLPSLVHLALLALQLLPGAIAWGWMIYEMVDVTPRFAITGAVINLIGNLVVGAVVMVLVPAMAAMLALHALHP